MQGRNAKGQFTAAANLGVGTSVRIDDRGLKRKIDAIVKRTSRPELLGAMGNTLVSWVDRNFRQQGIERPWKPLRPETIVRKRSSAILQDTGLLKNSFQPNNPKSGYRLSGWEVSVGTTVQYASTHERGDTSRGIPQRKMLPTLPTAKRICIESIKNIFAHLKDIR